MTGKYIQTLFIKVLNPIYDLTNKINANTRDKVVGILVFFLTMFLTLERSYRLRNPFFQEHLSSVFSQHLTCSLVLLLIAVMSIDRKQEKVCWRKSVILMQLIVGVGMIIISLIHPVGSGYRLMGFQIAFLFPCLYLIWNNRRDYEKLFRQISYSIIFSGLIIFLITLAIASTGTIDMSENNGLRFIGIMSNASCFSLVGLEMYLGGLYLLVTEKKNLPKALFYCASMGLGIGIILTGQMRVAALAVAVSSIVAAFFKLRYFKETLNVHRAFNAVVGCLVIVIMIFAVYGTVNIYNKSIVRNNSNAVIKDETSIADRLSVPTDGGVDKYSSGRIWIWKNYLRELNWIGNDYDQFDREKMTGAAYGYAHNVFLEVSYRFGIPMGIAFLVYMLVCGIPCLVYLFDGKGHKEPYLLFPIIAAIVFVLVSMLDCALMPFFQNEALMYYISIMAVIDLEVGSKSKIDRNA